MECVERGARAARRVVPRSGELELRKQENRTTGQLLQPVQREMGLSRRPMRVSLCKLRRSAEPLNESRGLGGPNRRNNCQ